jgi:hypothetical protein
MVPAELEGYYVRLCEIFLRQAKERGDIRLFVTGESFSSFDQRSKDLIHEAPQLLLDSDLGRANKGITLVLL